MVHVEAPRPPEANIPVFYNIESPVGRGCPNSLEDVLLVQFLLKSLAAHMTTPQGREIQPILRATPQNGVISPSYSSTDPTVESIEAYQRAMGIPVDGRVSPARGYFHSGGTIYTIISLNATVRGDYTRVWPRLDQIPNCPGGLQQILQRVV